jgi:hypothetical protein
MTDNEKAATFIGWKDADSNICLGYGIRHPDEPHYRCPCGWSANEYGLHGMSEARGGLKASTPDMIKPENYMRALEAVAAREDAIVETSLAPHREVEFRLPNGVWIIGGNKGDSIAQAAINALAALYDAEHPAVVKR